MGDVATATAAPSAGSVTQAKRSSTRFFTRLIREKPLGTASAVVVALLIIVSIFAGTLAPYDIFEVNAKNRLQGASAAHWLGTDHLGRDLLTRIIYGARLSLFVGLSATALNVVVALLVGGVSGFVGGRLDLVTQRFVDAWMAFPGLLLLLTIMSIVGRGIPQIIVTLGVSGGIVGSRVVRGAVIGVRENMYFQAARTVGSPTGRTILRHVIPNIALNVVVALLVGGVSGFVGGRLRCCVIPNIAPVLVVIFSINIGGVIISEASLSFLGFGLPIEVPSWGGLLSREGRRYMEQAPHLALWPGLALTITVYCLNNFGDAVRDLLDPRLRGGTGRYDRSRGARRLLETPAAGE